MVTGGLSDVLEGMGIDYQPLASTEVYYPSAGEWREVPAALPRPMGGVRVVTINNRVLLFGEITIQRLVEVDISIHCFYLNLKGGMDEDWTRYADILQFSDSEGEEKWTRVGEMSQSRFDHEVSVVDMNNFKKFCQ